MVDAVVDSDELLRRIQRAKAHARQELHTWQERDEAGPGVHGVSEARVRALAYEAVLRVLDEIVTPGRHGPEP